MREMGSLFLLITLTSIRKQLSLKPSKSKRNDVLPVTRGNCCETCFLLFFLCKNYVRATNDLMYIFQFAKILNLFDTAKI